MEKWGRNRSQSTLVQGYWLPCLRRKLRTNLNQQFGVGSVVITQTLPMWTGLVKILHVIMDMRHWKALRRVKTFLYFQDDLRIGCWEWTPKNDQSIKLKLLVVPQAVDFADSRVTNLGLQIAIVLLPVELTRWVHVLISRKKSGLKSSNRLLIQHSGHPLLTLDQRIGMTEVSYKVRQ